MEMKMKITLITAICFAFGSAGMAPPNPPKANETKTPVGLTFQSPDISGWL